MHHAALSGVSSLLCAAALVLPMRCGAGTVSPHAEGLAGLKLTVAPEQTQLRLASGGPLLMHWTLHNLSAAPLRLLTGVQTPGRLDMDPMQLLLTPQSFGTSHAEPTVLQLVGRRSAAKQIWALLQPGQSAQGTVNVADHIQAQGLVLQPGWYAVQASYQVSCPGAGEAPPRVTTSNTSPPQEGRLWCGVATAPTWRLEVLP